MIQLSHPGHHCPRVAACNHGLRMELRRLCSGLFQDRYTYTPTNKCMKYEDIVLQTGFTYYVYITLNPKW